MLTDSERARGWRGVVRVLPKPGAAIEKAPAPSGSGYIFRAPVLVETEDGGVFESMSHRLRKRDVVAVLAQLPRETSPEANAVQVMEGKLVGRRSSFPLGGGPRPFSW